MKTTKTTGHLSNEEVAALDPYALMAVLGKKVIHPGGRKSTQKLLKLAQLGPEHRVLEIGCGVGTTAIEIASRYGCHVTAVDIDPLMLERAQAAVDEAGLGDRVQIMQGDIQALPFPDEFADRVIVEAVTMFVDKQLAINEVKRVCVSGGLVLDHEFVYQTTPPAEVKQIVEGEICGGISFNTSEEWAQLYEQAGFTDIQTHEGPFLMMTPRGMLYDEGLGNTLSMMWRVLSRAAYRSRMMWLMSRMARAQRYLGYVVLCARNSP